MAEQLSDAEEISRAAAKIQYLLRAQQIQLDLTNTAEVNRDPPVKVQIFRPICAWILYRIPATNLLEPCGINRFDNPPGLKRKSISPKKSERVFSCARQSATVEQFLDLVAKSHSRIDHTF